MALEGLNLTSRQVIRPNHRINTSNEEPFVPQVQTIDSFARGDEASINLTSFQIDGSDNFVPGSCKQQVVLLMHSGVVDRVLEFVDTSASFALNVPLAHRAILRSTEQMVLLIGQVVDLIGVADKCAPVILGRVVDI